MTGQMYDEKMKKQQVRVIFFEDECQIYAN